MQRRQLVFRVHAIRRMFLRQVTPEDVAHVLDTGEVIEDYLDDRPYPSRLVLGYSGLRALHVVVADNQQDFESVIITVYEPDPDLWEPGFKMRKQK